MSSDSSQGSGSKCTLSRVRPQDQACDGESAGVVLPPAWRTRTVSIAVSLGRHCTNMHAEAQFKANLAFLANHPVHHQMYEQIHACPLTNLRLMPTPTGALYGEAFDMTTQQWSALCHPEDPVQQAIASVDQFYVPQARVFAMIGLGLGYNAVEFAKRLKPYQKLCIWDVDAQLFKAMLYAVDITPLFTLPNVNLIVGSDIHLKVEEWWLGLHAQEKLQIQMPMREGYTATYLKDSYEVIMSKTIDMLRFHAVGLSTWKLFGRCIGDNDLANLPEYFLNPGYEHLDGLWAGRPAVCVAAGPSLQKNLVALLPAPVREQVALLAVGTVYGLLQGLGLAPDVVTTIDFQRLNWTDQFQYLPLDPDCPLVYLHSTYPQTVRRWPGPTFVAENSSDTVTWLRRYGEGKKSAAEVQTVAHLNIKVALALGANPIILLGQDLSMPHDAHHAAGARAQDQAPNTTPPEAWVTVPDFEGHPVATRHSFLSMLTVFERLIAENPQTTFLNCSEAGLPLKGAHNVPLAEALALLPPQAPPAVPLRVTIKTQWRGYKPQIHDSLATDLAMLRQHVDDLRGFATEMQAIETRRLDLLPAGLSTDQEAARLAADVDTALGVIEQSQMQCDTAILAYEPRILGERAVAWGLFAIRRFDFIELMADPPPPPEAVATPEAQARFNAARVLRIATMIQEEAPSIARLVRDAERRLCGPAQASAIRLLAHQHYAPALAALQAPHTMAPQTVTRLLAQVYYHTQQYDAALALLATLDGTAGKRQRIQRHLAQSRADLRSALPAYFATREPLLLAASVPDTPATYY